MFEIELKAHVDDRPFVEKCLRSFAAYDSSVEKRDTYWGLVSSGRKVQARIRTETDCALRTSNVFFTYKQKERRISENGIETEVNDEKECALQDAAPLEAFFADAGLSVLLEKQKIVSRWHFEDAHIELCAVPPLGDFLEIEILSQRNDKKTVALCQKKIRTIFERCGIAEDKIEPRYYSDMIREAATRSCAAPSPLRSQ